MSYSLCPHLVQEYFERVSDIISTYRPQILKQISYEKISENLVLRGAIRPEEHERISQCRSGEGRVSQMLVVLGNRMWGLENILASFMEEHVNAWLTQEMFRAYNEHLVTPLRHKREGQICDCFRISNSFLYKAWVVALKSIDSWILKTGDYLGYVNHAIYPSENHNMLAFLSDKFADYTGGDSQSSDKSLLASYGFTPNASGEVQVAELEEDDINDLISLSESLCITYPSSSDEFKTGLIGGDDDGRITSPSPEKSTSSRSNVSAFETQRSGPGGLAKPVQRSTTPGRKASEDRSPSGSRISQRRSSEDGATSVEKQQKQRDLISRLSTPKATPTASKNPTVVRLRSTPDPSNSRLKQRPKSAEFSRSVSLSSPSSESSSTSSISSSRGNAARPKLERSATVSGKTTGFVRSKTTVPTSPKSKSTIAKPTAIAKPTVKARQGKVRQNSKTKEIRKNPEAIEELGDCNFSAETTDNSIFSDSAPGKYSAGDDDSDEDSDMPELSAGMSTVSLCKATLSSDQLQMDHLGYYQLNFDDYQDD